jgi:rhamnosyl/mannosyltransferase
LISDDEIKVPEKKRVLQICKYYYPVLGGIEKVARDVAEGLNDCVDMEVMTAAKVKKTRLEIMNGVKVMRVKMLGAAWSMPVAPGFTRNMIKLSKDTDVMIIHMPYPVADLSYWLTGFKGKVIAWWHSEIVRQKLVIPLYAPVLRKFLARVDKIITATPRHIEFSPFLQQFKDKCVIVPYGISDKDIALDSKGVELYNSLVKNNEKNLLFVGRLVYYKGVDVLLNAISMVPEAKLWIIGEGYLDNKLEKQAQNLGIEDRVRFLGALGRQEMLAYLHACTGFVLPSVEKSEAFALAQLEAIACGKPVINTMLESGVPFVSLDGETGWTVAPRDVNSLAGAIRELLNDDEEREKRGVQAKLRAETYFRMDDMLNAVLKLINER